MAMKTEDEARNHRCCGPAGCGREVIHTEIIPGDTERTTIQRYCVGALCMAWKWDTELNDQLIEDARVKFQESEDPRPLKDSPIYTDFLKSRQGYCGLAGKL